MECGRGCITRLQSTTGMLKGAVSQVHSLQLEKGKGLYHKFTAYNWDEEGGCITSLQHTTGM